MSQSSDCQCWTLIPPQIRHLLVRSVGRSAAESLNPAFASTLSSCVGIGSNPIYQCTIMIAWLQQRENPSWPENLGSRLAGRAAGRLSALLLRRDLAPLPSVRHRKASARLAVSAKTSLTP